MGGIANHVVGGTLQFLYDVTIFGNVVNLPIIGKLSNVMDYYDNDDFQNGRQAGRQLSNCLGVIEIGAGVLSLAASFILPIVSGGTAAACKAGTFGGCIVIAIPGVAMSVVASAALAEAGAGLTIHGAAVLTANGFNPINTKIGDSVPGYENTKYAKTRTPAGPNRDYEVRVTGKLDPNLAIKVKGVEFDWYDGNTLINAKNVRETRSWRDVSKTDKFTIKVKIPDIENAA